MKTLISSAWSPPGRLFLTTYDRPDHARTTREQGVVGVRVDKKGSASKANRLQIGDWILIRVSGPFAVSEDLFVLPPARVTGRPTLEKPGRERVGPWSRLLWAEEIETQQLIFPFRIPVTFEGAPPIRLGCFTWERLAELAFAGSKGQLLDKRQQWGIKFAGNLIDDRREVEALVQLIDVCAGVVTAGSE